MEDLITIQFHYKLLENGVSLKHSRVSVVGFEKENNESLLLVLLQTTEEWRWVHGVHTNSTQTGNKPAEDSDLCDSGIQTHFVCLWGRRCKTSYLIKNCSKENLLLKAFKQLSFSNEGKPLSANQKSVPDTLGNQTVLNCAGFFKDSGAIPTRQCSRLTWKWVEEPG